MKSFLFTSIIVTLICTACGLGAATNNGNQMISAATSGSCNYIQSGSCNITLTYNTGGASGLSIGIQYNGTSYPQEFQINMESCVVINQAYNQTCNVPVKYIGNGSGGHTQNMIFSLGNAQSNQVSVSD
ncbi:MAG: hypothetical protein ACK5WP_03495 [Neisseriaceae bacterium]